MLLFLSCFFSSLIYYSLLHSICTQSCYSRWFPTFYSQRTSFIFSRKLCRNTYIHCRFVHDMLYYVSVCESMYMYMYMYIYDILVKHTCKYFKTEDANYEYAFNIIIVNQWIKKDILHVHVYITNHDFLLTWIYGTTPLLNK